MGQPFDADDREVLDTFKVISTTPPEALGVYVISMASTPSDVLAVQLLLKSTGCSERMQVVPLFETLADLDNAAPVVNSLLEDPAYRARIEKQLMVMIGYSDSAKDAGMLAAGWAQYQAQEALVEDVRAIRCRADAVPRSWRHHWPRRRAGAPGVTLSAARHIGPGSAGD